MSYDFVCEFCKKVLNDNDVFMKSCYNDGEDYFACVLCWGKLELKKQIKIFHEKEMDPNYLDYDFMFTDIGLKHEINRLSKISEYYNARIQLLLRQDIKG